MSAIRIGSTNAAATAPARSSAFTAVVRPSTIANSSPPRRATVPFEPAIAVRRCATSLSNSSPTEWPRVSLISLNRSRSIMSAAVGRSGVASAMLSRRRISSRVRFGSPVRESCRAAISCRVAIMTAVRMATMTSTHSGAVQIEKARLAAIIGETPSTIGVTGNSSRMLERIERGTPEPELSANTVPVRMLLTTKYATAPPARPISC
jgi:hypothetical protein